jgi:lysophospholipase L1-like esterase
MSMPQDNQQILQTLQSMAALPNDDKRKIYDAVIEASVASEREKRQGRRQCISVGGMLPANNNVAGVAGAAEVQESQKEHTCTNKGGHVSGIKLHYLNAFHNTAGLSNASCDILLTTSILYALSGFTPRIAHFNSLNPATIGKGAWAVSTNSVDFPLEAGQKFYVRMGAQVPTGQPIIGCDPNTFTASLNDISVKHTDIIMPTTPQGIITAPCNSGGSLASYAPTNKVTSVFPVTPAYVSGICEVATPSVALYGDSNAAATGDNGTLVGAKGSISRAALLASSGITPLFNMARSGASLNNFNVGQSAQLFDCLDDFSHLFMQMGGNSVSGSLQPALSGNGVLTSFTLPFTVGNPANVLSVTIGGVVQATNTYTVLGNNITFTTAPASGSNNIVVFISNSDAAWVAGALLDMKQKAVRILRLAKMKGVKNVVLELLPRATDSSNTVTANGWQAGGLCDQYNAWLASVVGQKLDDNGNIVNDNSLLLIDIFVPMSDSIRDPITRRWAAANLTLDGVHLSTLGHTVDAARLMPVFNALTL